MDRVTRESPYQLALGERAWDLDPHLREYFSAVPNGRVGVGTGTFEEIGVTKRWVGILLRPVLRWLERRGVLFAGYETRVPFRIENRTIAGRNRTATVATRNIELPDRTWSMHDMVFRSGRHVVDQLGTPPVIAAKFTVDVDQGALTLASTSVQMRFAWLRIRIPACFAPVVRLRERFDETTAQHHVNLSISGPLIGRWYTYHGSFDYRLEPDQGNPWPMRAR